MTSGINLLVEKGGDGGSMPPGRRAAGPEWRIAQFFFEENFAFKNFVQIFVQIFVFKIFKIFIDSRTNPSVPSPHNISELQDHIVS